MQYIYTLFMIKSAIKRGLPVLILGISYMDRHFHPLAIACCSRETHFGYKFLFNCWLKGRELLDLEELNEVCLVADAADAVLALVRHQPLESIIRRGISDNEDLM